MSGWRLSFRDGHVETSSLYGDDDVVEMVNRIWKIIYNEDVIKNVTKIEIERRPW